MESARQQAYVQAYMLVEAVQGEDAAGALAAVDTAPGAQWPEVAFVLEIARTIYAITRPDPTLPVPESVQRLMDLADGAPARTAIALGLRAVSSVGSDPAALMADTSRAVALLHDETLPAPERCFAYVAAAAALSSLRLWELMDELYTKAIELGPAADAAQQAGAVAVNRMLTRLEWGLALLEAGDEAGAQERFAEAAEAVPAARAQQLPVLWRRDVNAVEDLVRLLSGEEPARSMAEHRAGLVEVDDVEVLPLLDAVVALCLFRSGRTAAALEAAELLSPIRSASTGSRSFPLWVRAVVLASPASQAERDHASILTRLLWEARTAVLAAARAQISVELRRSEHSRLSRAATTDALTGLQNRRAFDAWMGQAHEVEPRTTALMVVDMDDFKAVNDTHGHAAGDEVLRRVGRLIRAAIRPGDLALRQGGDEFAVVLTGEPLTSEVVMERARMLAELIAKEPWDEVAPELSVRASIGVALRPSIGGPDPCGPWLYRAADGALYRAKHDNDRVALASPTWPAKSARRSR